MLKYDEATLYKMMQVIPLKQRQKNILKHHKNF
jgi:hypothetical protein